MKFILSLVLTLLGFAGLTAQTNVGIFTQASFSTISTPFDLSNVAAYHSRTAFSGGITVEQEFGDVFALETGAYYIPKGFTVKQRLDQTVLGMNLPIGYTLHTDINYIQVPLFLKAKLGNDVVKAILKAGPRVSYATHGRLQGRANLLLEFNVLDIPLPLDQIGLNRWDVGAVFGTGVEFKTTAGIFSIEANYDIGLKDMVSVGIIDAPFRNNTLSIGAGWKIPL